MRTYLLGYSYILYRFCLKFDKSVQKSLFKGIPSSTLKLVSQGLLEFNPDLLASLDEKCKKLGFKGKI